MNYFQRKSLYSKEDNSSSDDSDEEECGAREVLFISQETQNDDNEIFEEDEINDE